MGTHACPHCNKAFPKWKSCQLHLLQTDHLGPLRAQYGTEKGWPQEVERRCSKHAVAMRNDIRKGRTAATVKAKHTSVSSTSRETEPSLYQLLEGQISNLEAQVTPAKEVSDRDGFVFDSDFVLRVFRVFTFNAYCPHELLVLGER